MHHVIGALLIGAIGGSATGNFERRRRIARTLIKGGIIAKRRIEAAGASALAETKKLVEEARTDLDHPGTEPQN
jgi:hypothetical protein